MFNLNRIQRKTTTQIQIKIFLKKKTKISRIWISRKSVSLSTPPLPNMHNLGNWSRLQETHTTCDSLVRTQIQKMYVYRYICKKDILGTIREICIGNIYTYTLKNRRHTYILTDITVSMKVFEC